MMTTKVCYDFVGFFLFHLDKLLTFIAQLLLKRLL